MELGQKLREARQAKGLSLDELQDITKIQKRYLMSIEEGNFEVLPGEFYVRAFIKQYAEAVGFDPEALVEEHKQDLPAPPDSHDVTQLSRVKRSREAVATSTTSTVMDYMPKLLITFLIVAVGVGIWLVSQAFSKQEQAQIQNNADSQAEVEKTEDSPLETKEEPEEAEPKEPEKEQEEPVQPTQEITVTGTAGKTSTLEIRNNSALVVEISAKGRAYVDIKNGVGKLFYSKTLSPGETYQQDLSAEDVVRLNVGSSPNTEIKINGQVVSFPQNPNDFYHQILMIKNLRMQQPAQQ